MDIGLTIPTAVTHVHQKLYISQPDDVSFIEKAEEGTDLLREIHGDLIFDVYEDETFTPEPIDIVVDLIIHVRHDEDFPCEVDHQTTSNSLEFKR